MFINIDKFLDDNDNKQSATLFDRQQENEIVIKSIEKCLNNPNTYVVVRDNFIKDYTINKAKNSLDLDYKEVKQLIKTQYDIFKEGNIEGIINLFLDYGISKSIKEKYENIYCKSFVHDNFITNEYEDKKQNLSTKDFQDAIRTVLDYKDDSYLIEIKAKALDEEPEVYYKGQKMNIDNYTGLDYGFRYEDDYQGKHFLNIQLDDEDGTSKLVKHL